MRCNTQDIPASTSSYCPCNAVYGAWTEKIIAVLQCSVYRIHSVCCLGHRLLDILRRSDTWELQHFRVHRDLLPGRVVVGHELQGK